ncbi:porin [Roseateles sp. BYS180W]|uniref:Porin n=1 Tax=Roseateles rivi TaxID=3299028 RepID=A0ABW7FRB0_9BURK
MKKSLVALAALAGIAGSAAAQSSVTLFGVVDAAARYSKASGQDKKSLISGGSSTARFGVRGVEDLGGGLKAGFWLESELGTDAGSAGADGKFWNRRATISLTGEFGEIRLGRDKGSSRLVVDEFDIYSTVGNGAVNKVYGLPGASFINRFDNQVKYVLPELGGLYGSVDVSAGEGTDPLNKSIGGRLGYKVGGFKIAGGYSESGVSNKFKHLSVGTSYDFGTVALNGLFTQNKSGANSIDVWTLGAVAPVFGSGAVSAQVSFANGSAKVGDAKHFTVGYQHNLSKRTAFYTTASVIDNDSPAAFSVDLKPNAGGRSGAIDVGVKHSF